MKINNTSVQLIKITNNEATQRIDNFLLTRLKGVPKSMIYRILRQGQVRVNKRRIKAQYKLSKDDIVRIPPVRLATRGVVAMSAKLNQVAALDNCILYEDNHVLIINKPSGTAVHGGSGLNFGVIEGLRTKRPDTHFLELVHRLDRDTSGVLMLAKQRSALRSLHEQLRMKTIQKDYLALVRGQWPSHCKVVQAPLLKKISYRGERIVQVSSKGKSSETCFEVKARYTIATLVKASPITGRTHQIRAHALHVGHPIAFDDRYGNHEFDQQLINTGLKRLFLHAIALRFKHPVSNKTICIKAPLDEDLLHCLRKLHHQIIQ
ncbi:ribosomal large subunit pseudouridine synthase C [Serratia symbiotica str. 'Cinara cedri']|nr:ribosomal large subunit pseudouridine synthase C [Serratia symbiotica str. 'Cinara cedri']